MNKQITCVHFKIISYVLKENMRAQPWIINISIPLHIFLGVMPRDTSPPTLPSYFPSIFYFAFYIFKSSLLDTVPLIMPGVTNICIHIFISTVYYSYLCHAMTVHFRDPPLFISTASFLNVISLICVITTVTVWWLTEKDNFVGSATVI